MIGRIAAVAAASTLLVAPSARAALLKGTVTGSPYVASASTTAVPVTFSKSSAQRAGLRSPVGVIVVPRTHAIPTPDGPVAPGALRLGDRFRFSTTVPRSAATAVYTRLATSRLSVYRRSKTLSNDELTTRLVLVGQYINALGAALQRAGAETEALASALATIRQTLADVITRLTQTGVTGLPDATAALGDVQQQLAAVQQQLATAAGGAQGTLSGAAGALTGALPSLP